MAQTRRSCFVISPIGSEGTPIRQAADDFLELLIEPALAPFSFDVIRADKIAKPTLITADIINLVQQSDLCVVDLTGHNANVYYECGRRHETGRPFVQLIRKGESLPFDVAGIRTIQYDLSDARTTLSSVREVQSFVRAIEAEGWDVGSSGESLASMAEALRRVERKLNQLGSSNADSTTIARPGISGTDYLTEHPKIAFMRLFRAGDISSAIALLPRIKRTLVPDALVDAAAWLARAGEAEGRKTLEEILQAPPDGVTQEGLVLAFFALKEYFYNTDHEKEGIEQLTTHLRNLEASKRAGDASVAEMLNYLQMLKYVVKDHSGAEKDLLRSISLAPDKASPRYNLALIYEAEGRDDDLVRTIDGLLKLESATQIHLEKAISVYRSIGRDSDASVVVERLKRLAQPAS